MCATAWRTPLSARAAGSYTSRKAVTDPTVGALAARIETRLDPALMEGKFENASRATVAVHLKDGRVLRCASTGRSGLGTLSKSEEQHLSDFYEHTGSGSKAIDRAAAEQIAELPGRLATIPAVGALLPPIMTTPTTVPGTTQ